MPQARYVSRTDKLCRPGRCVEFRVGRSGSSIRLKFRTRDEVRTSREHVCLGGADCAGRPLRLGGRARSGLAASQGTEPRRQKGERLRDFVPSIRLVLDATVVKKVSVSHKSIIW